MCGRTWNPSASGVFPPCSEIQGEIQTSVPPATNTKGSNKHLPKYRWFLTAAHFACALHHPFLDANTTQKSPKSPGWLKRWTSWRPEHVCSFRSKTYFRIPHMVTDRLWGGTGKEKPAGRAHPGDLPVQTRLRHKPFRKS